MRENRIGPYRLMDKLGEGGMGVVYRARHHVSQQSVALKTVRVPASRWTDSIRREVQALTRLQHPGLVRIVCHGVHDGLPWYAMDLLEGETLRHLCRRMWSQSTAHPEVPTPSGFTEELPSTEGLAPLSASGIESYSEDERAIVDDLRRVQPPVAAAGELRSVLRIVRRICASLSFLHGEGFINCDLKPDNVMIVDGRPVIIDFGLSAHHPGSSGREALDLQQRRAGTVAYMSPEQIRGELLDARSDLYAIGCILYELLVGRPPFVGSARAIALQHLSSPPLAPSTLVQGVPAALERLVLSLLEKCPRDRIGYADEVEAALASLSGDVDHLHGYPSARSYLYRPGFVGRHHALDELSALRDRTRGGSGALVLLGGESGSGKTRLAMELSRSCEGSMRAVSSETALLSPEPGHDLGPTALSAFRPLLRALADDCRAEPESTELLLADDHAVLAPYEPSLAALAKATPEEALPALPPEAARQRLFAALRATLSRYAQERPLLYVIDDLSWIDSLSRAFLASLDADYLARTPLLIVCTYRSEEADEEVAKLRELPFVEHLQLGPLGKDAVRELISDMLALRPAPTPFVELVAREAEGNPFFVGEYLRAAVRERLVQRVVYSWRVTAPAKGTEAAPTLALPSSLAKLIEQRLGSLSTPARSLVVAAAVLGREFDASYLVDVSQLSEQAVGSALDELLRRQILEQLAAGRVRFVHDKLREVTYGSAPDGTLPLLHERTALLMARSPAERDDPTCWSAMGQHFALAARHADALRYLAKAAAYAIDVSAHQEAERLYAQAITHAEAIASESPEKLAALLEAYGDLLALLGKRELARDAFARSGAGVPAHERAVRARRERKLGKTWEVEHEHGRALAHYTRAAGLLSTDDSAAMTQPERDEWIQCHLDRLWVHYWLGQVEEMDALSATLAHHLAAASPLQRARFFDARMKCGLRRTRYVIDDETVAFAQRYLDACVEGKLRQDLPMGYFNYGFVMTFRRELGAAEESLQTALSLARGNGDLALQVRCLSYLALASRFAGDVELTTTRAQEAEALSLAAGLREYVGAARAHQSWVQVHRGDLAGASALADDALSLWESTSLVFAFEWLAILPWMAAQRESATVPDLLARMLRLVQSGQQPLPEVAWGPLRHLLDDSSPEREEILRSTLAGMLSKLPTGYC